jgi:TRAP transporter TAXI family solute receptor
MVIRLNTILAGLAGALICAFVAAGAAAQSPEVLREQTNRGTVGIISGGINGTYIRIATDLASVLDDGESVRVLAIMGKGSVQNIDDIMYLRGIDVGIVQSDVFAFVKSQNRHPTIDQRIHYITKLYNEEFHLLARKNIATVEDLAGQKVNFGVQGSGTYMTGSIVFDKLDVEVEPVSLDQGLALEKLRTGEIAALVYVAGKPTALFNEIQPADDLHLLPIPLNPTILETYLPSWFTNEDYPNVVPKGQTVKTVAVGAVMAVYNWDPGTPRYRKVARFIDAFFSRFEEFQKPPRHPKWQDVSLTAEVPGWNRFRPAEEWLRKSATKGTGTLRSAFEAFLEDQAPDLASQLDTPEQKEELFKLFLLWQNEQPQ